MHPDLSSQTPTDGGRAVGRRDFQRYLFSSFVANLALPIFYIFLPLLAKQIGASILEIGLVGGAANAVYSFMPFVMGHFSDRSGARKLFIIAAFATLGTVSALYVIITSPIALIGTRVVEGIGWAMLWPAIEAGISHDSSRDAKKSLSIFNFVWSGAAAFGPLVGSVLIFLFSIRFAYEITSVILLIMVLVNVVPFLRERNERNGNSKVTIATHVVQQNVENPQKLSELQRQRRVRIAFYMISTALAAVSSGILFTFFPPYASSIGISILLIGVITFVYGLGRFLTYVLTINERARHSLLSHRGRLRNLIAALVMMSVSSLLIVFRDTSGIIYTVSFALVGFGYSVVYAISQVGMIAEERPEKMGAGAGLFESSIGIGSSIGPIVAGIVSGNSLIVPFFVPTVSLFLTLAVLGYLAARSKGRIFVS